MGIKLGLRSGMLAIAAMATLGGAAARADLLLQNEAGQSVQYTVYNGSGQPIAGGSGCMSQGANRIFSGSEYAVGRGIYIQGILRSRSDCTGSSVSNTGRGSRILLQATTVKTWKNFQGRLILQ